MNTTHNRRHFLKGSLGLVVLSTVGGRMLYGRIFPDSYEPRGGNTVLATYSLRVSDYPTVETTLHADAGSVRVGLTEVGSAIKLVSERELLMNPEHCARTGRDGVAYPISVIRVKEKGEDAFTAVSTWCPHNNKSQLWEFDYKLGDGGLFVCGEHQFSCYRADGTWVSPEQCPYPDAPPMDEFHFNLNDDGTPHLMRFRTTFDGVDTITIHDLLCECSPCVEE